jgi:hypothetical protein
LVLAFLLVTPFAEAIPPPGRFFVDCSEPVCAVDQLVCADPRLLAPERCPRALNLERITLLREIEDTSRPAPSVSVR